MIGVPFTFRALITNHSDAPRMVSANLVIDGQPLSQRPVELAPGRSKIVRFTHRFAAPGWFRGYVEVGPPALTATGMSSVSGGGDSLAVDNRRYFALRVEKDVKLLAIDGAPSAVATNDELFFLRLALTVNPTAANTPSTAKPAAAPPTPIQIKPGTVADRNPARLAGYPLVVLANVANLPPASLEALEHYVDGGGNLLVTLGDRVDPKAYDTWVGGNRLYGGVLFRPSHKNHRRPAGSALDTDTNNSPDDPNASPGAPSAPRGERRWVHRLRHRRPSRPRRFHGRPVRQPLLRPLHRPLRPRRARRPGSHAGAQRRPAAHELKNASAAAASCSSPASIDRDCDQLPAFQPAYVPSLSPHRRLLAQGDARETRASCAPARSSPSPLRRCRSSRSRSRAPTGRSSTPEPAHLRTVTRATAGRSSPDTEQAGVYSIRSAAEKNDPTPRLLLAANLPSEESDANDLDEKNLRPLIDPDTPWGFIDSPEAAVNAGELTRRGYGLWDQLLLAALGGRGAVEPWLANRLSKKRGQTSADAMRQARCGTMLVKAAA